MIVLSSLVFFLHVAKDKCARLMRSEREEESENGGKTETKKERRRKTIAKFAKSVVLCSSREHPSHCE
jgi:hypothetical protein